MSAALLTGWAIDALIASTLLMAAVLLVREPVRKAFGPQLAYALWALPLLRLMLPPMPESWRQAATPISRAGETITVYVTDPGSHAVTTGLAAPASHHPSLGLIMAGLWGAGAAAFLLWHLVQHTRFCRRMIGTGERLADEQGVRVIASAAAPGPLAFGIVRRYVAFPRDFAGRYDADERALALAHEIGHHQRGDLIANWAALFVLALHWFNPVAWRAFRAFRADQELANDARVLAGRSPTDRHIYACAIVKAAHGGAVSAACHLHSITDLKGRLKMLATSPKSRRRLASGAATIGVLLATGLGLTASGSGAAAISDGIKQAVDAPAAASPAPSSTDTAPHAVRNVTIVRDGKATVYPSADIDAHMAAGDTVSINPMDAKGTRVIVKADNDPATRVEVQDIPAISSAKCGIGTGEPMVIDTREGNSKGERRRIVICTDRIEKAAADGAAMAANSKDIERNALASALSGLQAARSTVEGNQSMTAQQRAEALASIDTSLAEVQADIAKVN